MKATLPWLAALLSTAVFGSLAQAQYIACSPALQRPLLQAPDACGPGFYWIDCWGTVYGPAYCVYPCFPPFQGVLPGRSAQGSYNMVPGHGPVQMPPTGPPPTMPTVGNPYGGNVSFPTHPYARGPRDFFMWNEVQAERHLRERRPPIIP